MALTDVCPNRTELIEVLAGRAAGSSDAVLRHLEECSSCSALAEKLLLDDDLTRLIQSPTQVADVGDSAQVREVMRRLNSLLTSRFPEDTETPASGLPTLKFGNESTRSVQADEIKRLMPAELPEELGRLGHYRVLKLLGCGGMGAVFLAEDTRLQRRVALKVLRARRCQDDLHRERFLREARLAAAVRNENVVTIHDVGVAVGPQGDVPYLAMEFLDGESLEQTLRRRGALSLIEAVEVAEKVASALAAAHERGMIHRDIKPANVFLESSRSCDPPREQELREVSLQFAANSPLLTRRVTGADPKPAVKVLDFGLALPINLSGDGRLTDSGMLLGTPAYMSPEQANGCPLDARTDLFSLGSLLYEAVTGRRPFGGETIAQQLSALLTATPVPLHVVIPRDPPRQQGTFYCDPPRQQGRAFPVASSSEPRNESSLADAAGHRTAASADHMELSDLVMQLLQRDPQLRPSSAIEVRDQLRTIRTQLETQRAGERSQTSPDRSRVKRSSSLTLRVSFLGVVVLLLGVIITITRKDGSTTTIEADDVKSVTITGLDGKADVTLVPAGKPVESTAVTATNSETLVKERLQNVRQEMAKQNPNWDVTTSFRPGVVSGEVVELTLFTPGLESLSPVTKLRGLKKFTAYKPSPMWVANHELPNTVSDIEALRGLPLTSVMLNDFTSLTDLSPLEDLPLQHLELYATPLADPHWLKRFKLKALNIGGRTESFDLSVLKEMPLETLYLNESSFDDLSPLRGMMLKTLQCGATRITDLSPLEGMPLEHLVCVKCPIRDWTPLTKLPKLQVLRADLPLDQARLLLPQISTLKTINGKSVSDFLNPP